MGELKRRIRPMEDIMAMQFNEIDSQLQAFILKDQIKDMYYETLGEIWNRRIALRTGTVKAWYSYLMQCLNRARTVDADGCCLQQLGMVVRILAERKKIKILPHSGYGEGK